MPRPRAAGAGPDRRSAAGHRASALQQVQAVSDSARQHAAQLQREKTRIEERHDAELRILRRLWGAPDR